MEKSFDFKKDLKELYMPKATPTLIDVPALQFIMVDGAGDPNGGEYPKAVAVVYALAYTIKMSKMGTYKIDGYFDYVVAPLEGLWWITDEDFSFEKRDNWLWTSMMAQPDFVTADVFQWAKAEVKRKKPELDCSKARLEGFTEGLCVQMMHHGPYSEEPANVELMHRFMAEKGYKDDTGNHRKHHEIYLSDPRKVLPEKMKTVLRHPVSPVTDHGSY